MTLYNLRTISILVFLSFFGCKTKETILEPITVGDPFEVPIWKYSINHFFIDTLYATNYDQFIQNTTRSPHPEYNIKSIQVWKQQSGLANPNSLFAKAFITCPASNSSSYDSMRTLGDVPGHIETEIFSPLDGTSYSYDPLGGTITILDSTISDDLSIAISYERYDGNQFGETPFTVPRDSMQRLRTMILKLIRPHALQPAYSIGWKLLMKNIYFIGKMEVAHTGFSLDVFTDFQNAIQSDSISGIPLLTVLGLDRFHLDGAVGSDGIFDFLPNVTIDKVHGEIVFPNLRPFDDGIRNYFKSIGQPLPSNSRFLLPALYDTTSYALKYSTNSYVIKGRAVN